VSYHREVEAKAQVARRSGQTRIRAWKILLPKLFAGWIYPRPLPWPMHWTALVEEIALVVFDT
jgi:hypothetical protein